MEQEIIRLIELLPKLDPTSPAYKSVLDNIRSLLWIDADLNSEHSQSDCITPAYEVKSGDIPSPEPTPFPEPVQATVVADPKPVVSVTVEAKGEYTKEEVRDALSKASKSGIQIQPIIAKYVPEGKSIKFSEIPASSYPEIMEEIKNA